MRIQALVAHGVRNLHPVQLEPGGDALAHAESVTAATISITTAGSPLRFAARSTGDPLVRAVADLLVRIGMTTLR